jgi:ketosteroid isomerase-like protein/predicted nucleotidyltransferase
VASFGSAVRAYIEELTRRVTESLGEAACGVWLFGSAALGDFAPERSDMDVQAVTTTRLPRATRERLAAALDHDVLPCPARKLEFVLYAVDDLRDPSGPAFQLNLNTGSGLSRHVSFDPVEEPRFWFVIDVAIGREHGVALAGPPAGSVFPKLPRRLIIDALAAALDWYESSSGAPAETILSACRTWAWATDGHWRSKVDSGRWAQDQLPDSASVEAALRSRDDTGAASPQPHEVALLLDRARKALRSAMTTVDAGGPRDTGRGMSQDNVAFATDVVAAFNRRDVPGLVELVTDDFEWVTWTGAVQSTVYRGAEGLESYFRDADVWEHLNLEVREYRDLGDEVFVVGVFHARGGGSGVEIHAPYYSAFFISGGRLAQVLSFRTEAQALRALGRRD